MDRRHRQRDPGPCGVRHGIATAPPRADRARIDAWSIDVHQRYWDRPERVDVLHDAMGYGEFFTPEIGGLIRELADLGYWDNHIASLWLQGRVSEMYRLRAEASPEDQERLAFFAAVLRHELDRVRAGGHI